jgi:hypothetical protein
MELPYNNKFMGNDEFEALLEMCSACSHSENGENMLMANLAKIHEYSGELMSMLSKDSEAPDWVEDKISKASQSISDVKHYIEYSNSAYAANVQMGGVSSFAAASSAPVYSGGCGEKQPSQSERMPIMSQNPAMTPPSRVGAASPQYQQHDMDDDMDMDDMDDMGDEDDDIDGVVLSLAEAGPWTGRNFDDKSSPYDDDWEPNQAPNDLEWEDEMSTDWEEHLSPKTLGDIVSSADRGSNREEMQMLKMYPRDTRNQIISLAQKNGMSPSDYLKHLGFEDNSEMQDIVDNKPSLWNL